MAYFRSTQESQIQFRQRLIDLLNHANCYEDKRNRDAALAVVPVNDLTQISQAKYDSSTATGTCGTVIEENSSQVIRDILLLELLDWFKNNFFSWMNQPACPNCNNSTSLIGMGVPTLEEEHKSATRVEVYTCPRCYPNQSTTEVARFPRYNNPAVLLETRIGRCGEWANCFALICRAMGFEVRHVTDWLDHVWVEVFSNVKGNWIHTDPCENKWDSPLLYEEGWGKKLTYVIAVSYEDIQDVTWRYCHSKNHKAVLARRTLVDEQWLVKTIVELRSQRQSFLGEDRKHILKLRLVTELVEFLRTTTDVIKSSEKGGRESGSLVWRIARSEIGPGQGTRQRKGYEWEITEDIIREFGLKLKLYYDCSADAYFIGTSTNEVKRGWENGLFEVENMSRKDEKDWNMVYLARQENDIPETGKLSWKFKLHESAQKFKIESVHLFIKSTTFHPSASVLVEVSNDKGNSKVPVTAHTNGAWIWKFALDKVQWVTVTCILEGGHGNLAWQHAQLFRQSTKQEPQSREPLVRPMRIVINIKEEK